MDNLVKIKDYEITDKQIELTSLHIVLPIGQLREMAQPGDRIGLFVQAGTGLIVVGRIAEDGTLAQGK